MNRPLGDVAAYLLECADDLRGTERTFARDMQARIAAGGSITERQEKWLRSIYHRLIFQGGRQ